MNKIERDLVYGWLSSIEQTAEDDGMMTRGEKLQKISDFTKYCKSYIDEIYNNPFMTTVKE